MSFFHEPFGFGVQRSFAGSTVDPLRDFAESGFMTRQRQR
jgi:hypothetical protein